MSMGNSFRRLSALRALTLAVSGAALLVGCGSGDKPRAATSSDPLDVATVPVYKALEGTIGQYAVFADAAPMAVEGWGLVVGLPGTGAGDMSPEIRGILSDQLYRKGLGSYVKGTETMNPERILASKEVAAVEVRGLIPAMAKEGDTFDLQIKTIPNTQVTSLSDGLLWTSELRQIGFQIGMETKTLATGRGPLFLPTVVHSAMEPLGSEAAAAGTQPALGTHSLRSGVVIGGGVVTEAREIRLQLLTTSNRMAAAIERSINSRFPGREKCADALSGSLIELTVPRDFMGNPKEFIDVVKHMYLAQEVPGFTEKKTLELIAALRDPKAPHEEISLALQGLGRSILPDYLQPLYTSPDPTVRFWAARAGGAMQDVGGMVVLQEFVKDETSPFHNTARDSIVAISHGGDTVRATLTLSALLNSSNTDDRIQGYEGLVAIGSRAIRTYDVSRKYLLDVVPSDGPPLIYVTQSKLPRIALIGRDLHLPQGAFYVSPDNALTLNVLDPSADTGDASNVTAEKDVLTASAGAGAEKPLNAATPATKDNVVLYWHPSQGDKVVNLKSAPGLVDVLITLSLTQSPLSKSYDANKPYIGASYQRVVEMLASMSRDQLIDAKFVMEKSTAPVLAPEVDMVTPGRPEGSTGVMPKESQTQPASMGAVK